MYLHYPTNTIGTFKIIGIDPGSQFLGISIFEVDIVTRDIINSTAFTFLCDNQYVSTWTANQYGNGISRVNTIRDRLLEVFLSVKPNIIISESPFMSMATPGSYAILILVINAIREAIYMYNPWIKLELVPPSLVKKAIGAPAHCTKDEMLDAIVKVKYLNYMGDIPLTKLGKDSIDALAVGIYRLLILDGVTI